ncbi:MAG: hypothetical protein IPG43_23185 [Proteobacteria bacterium]|nr:hypothetical protein [Pseudomonadota bacterium]
MMTERRAEVRALMGLGLLAAVMLVYLPGVGGGFVFDDYHTIVDNLALADADKSLSALFDAAMSGVGTGPLARPLAMLSFALNRALTGLAPEPFKITNLVIHALNALLVWAFMARIVPSLAPRAPRASAWLVAALWALHPINLTSVLYVVQRMTSLSATFVLLTLVLYITARRRQLRGLPVPRVWSLLGAGLVLLALLAKETALSLAFYLLLIEWLVIRGARTTMSATLRRRLGALALAVLVAGLWYFVREVEPGYRGREFTLGERVLSEARVMFLYLRLLLVPTPDAFALFHDDLALSRGWLQPPTTVLAVVGLAVISAWALARREARPWLAFGWAWFLLGHLLEGSIIPLELAHEHRNYLPGLGVLTAGTLAFAELLATPRRRVGAAALALLLLAAVTFTRATLWASPSALVESDLRHHPHSPRLWYEAGRLRLEAAGQDAGRYAAGITALEQAARLAPIKTLPLSALLMTAIERGDRAAVSRLVPLIVAQPRDTVGEEIFRELVICQGYGRCRRDTDSVQVLANALLARKDLSIASRQRVLEWLAVFYARMLGDSAAAITILEDLVAAQPHNAPLKTRLAEAHASAGNQARATALASEARAALPWSARFMQRSLLIRLSRLTSAAHDD